MVAPESTIWALWTTDSDAAARVGMGAGGRGVGASGCVGLLG